MKKILATIIAIGDVNLQDLVILRKLLNKIFINIDFKVSLTKLEPPMSFYDWGRMQYISRGLLRYVDDLKTKLGIDLILAVAGLDAYEYGLNFVFGEAALGQGSAIVYTSRLINDNKSIYYERLLKESLHEIGHALGLNHCKSSGCVMQFSNSLAEVDRKKPMYCKKCAAMLREKGVLVAQEYIIG